MLLIVCLICFVGAIIALGLIVLAYFKDRSLVLPYILLFVFIAGFGVSLFLDIKGVGTSLDKKPDQSSHPASSDVPSEDSSQSDTKQPDDASSPAANTGALGIGDSATIGDWDITVTDFYYTDRIETGTLGYYHPDDGSQYAVIAARVTNNGTASDIFLPTISGNDDVEAHLYYAGKYTYAPSMFIGVDGDLGSDVINPLASKDGIIAFSVPDVVVDGADSLSVSFTCGGDELSFSLR